jgi:hypothetical protein
MTVEQIDTDLVIHTLFVDGKLVYVYEDETETDEGTIIDMYENL